MEDLCMKRLSAVTLLVLLIMLMPILVFGQNATLGGTVVDDSGALVPGVTITAKNNATGVAIAATSNQAGAYSLPSLLPGDYTVSAEKPGFQTQTYTNVTLLAAGQRRLNFTLKLAGIATSLEVSTSAEQLVLESSSSVGDVLSEESVKELPMVNRNALDLVKVMSGVILADDTIFNANASSFAGVSASGVNIQRDGVMVNDVRYPAGINAATRVNPDLVGEFRMILAPVDAEAGRGNAQIQILTKSGTNKYHGNLVWNVQNSAIDPNTWEQNRTKSAPPWRNLHQYSASIGGPIVKNKTFFFVLFDGQVNKIRTDMNLLTLTPCAAKGVYRFYDNWNNGNALQLLTLGSTPRYATVDLSGNPIAPPYQNPSDPNSGPHNGILRYASVWGPITNLNSLAPDCSNLEIGGVPFSESSSWVNPSPWDVNRPVRDPSGFIDYFMSTLFPINNYEVGDGLNAAGYKYPRTLKGADNRFGVGEDTYRRQINVRIDHNFSSSHRVSGSWSWERDDAENNFFQTPKGFGGHNTRRPMVLTINVVSTLKPTLLNEFKIGMSRTGTNGYAPYNNPENDTGKKVQELYRQLNMATANGQAVVIGPGMGSFSWAADTQNGNFYGGRANVAASTEDISPRWSYGDTMSWTRGSHSMRFGGEFRTASSEARDYWTGAFTLGHTSWPYMHGGEGTVTTPTTYTHFTGSLAGTDTTGNRRALRDLLVFQTGSMDRIHQWRFINNINQTTFNDPVKELASKRKTIAREFSLFFKDDWKVTNSLTLNLGIRYDFYGVPFLDNGMTTGLYTNHTVGGAALFGPTLGFQNWFTPNATADASALVTLQSIGPGGPNPDLRLFNVDKNNFGPAVGFAYQLPWFGKGKTTIRGGYQISYIGMSGNFAGIASAAGSAPGTSYLNTYRSVPAGSKYLGLADLKNLPDVPMPPGVLPGFKEFTLYDRQQTLTAYAPNYSFPYIQNLTLAVTRNVTSSLTVDLRYVGTLTRKNFSSLNLNYPNFTTNGLLEAFDAARRGENPALLDQLMQGVRLATTSSGPIVNTPGNPNYDASKPTLTGAEALRTTANPNPYIVGGTAGSGQSYRAMLANGNYAGLANALNVAALPGGPLGQYIERNGFPVNFIKASPQFSSAILNSNQGHSNYHSLQAQVTLRPVAGLNFQSTYTWSKNLGITGSAPTDPSNLGADYTLLPSNRTHSWVTYGGWELPFGPGKWIGGKTTGWLARAAEGWQTSWITNVASGTPLSITANSMLYANGTPDVVNGGFDSSVVGVYWPHGASAGNYFHNRYTTALDPVCSSSAVAPSIRSYCTLNGVKDVNSGQFVLVHPAPGKRGNLGLNTLTNIGRWNVDMSIAKGVQVGEGRSVKIRLDATNIFNHPFASGTLGVSGTRIVFPTSPAVDINSGTFGAFSYKVGGRTFQFMARYDF
jgi:hypothetical protein